MPLSPINVCKMVLRQRYVEVNAEAQHFVPNIMLFLVWTRRTLLLIRNSNMMQLERCCSEPKAGNLGFRQPRAERWGVAVRVSWVATRVGFSGNQEVANGPHRRAFRRCGLLFVRSAPSPKNNVVLSRAWPMRKDIVTGRESQSPPKQLRGRRIRYQHFRRDWSCDVRLETRRWAPRRKLRPEDADRTWRQSWMESRHTSAAYCKSKKMHTGVPVGTGSCGSGKWSASKKPWKFSRVVGILGCSSRGRVRRRRDHKPEHHIADACGRTSGGAPFRSAVSVKRANPIHQWTCPSLQSRGRWDGWLFDWCAAGDSSVWVREVGSFSQRWPLKNVWKTWAHAKAVMRRMRPWVQSSKSPESSLFSCWWLQAYTTASTRPTARTRYWSRTRYCHRDKSPVPGDRGEGREAGLRSRKDSRGWKRSLQDEDIGYSAAKFPVDLRIPTDRNHQSPQRRGEYSCVSDEQLSAMRGRVAHKRAKRARAQLCAQASWSLVEPGRHSPAKYVRCATGWLQNRRLDARWTMLELRWNLDTWMLAFIKRDTNCST